MPSQQRDLMGGMVVLPADLAADPLGLVLVFFANGPFIAGPAASGNGDVTQGSILQVLAQHANDGLIPIGFLADAGPRARQGFHVAYQGTIGG